MNTNLPVRFEDMKPEHIRFAFWLSTVPGLRNPKTQAALAEEIGMSRETLSRWLQRPKFQALHRQVVRQVYSENLGEVVDALTQEALSGNVKAIELYLRHVGLLWNADGDGGQQQQQSTNEHGQGLLAALQSGRLAEQLASVVAAGKREMAQIKEGLNEQAVDAEIISKKP